jgi:hypothetical protein
VPLPRSQTCCPSCTGSTTCCCGTGLRQTARCQLKGQHRHRSHCTAKARFSACRVIRLEPILQAQITFLQHRPPQRTEVLLQWRQRLLLQSSDAPWWTRHFFTNVIQYQPAIRTGTALLLRLVEGLASSDAKRCSNTKWLLRERTSSSPTYRGFSTAHAAGEWKPANTSVASLPAYVYTTRPPGCSGAQLLTSYTCDGVCKASVGCASKTKAGPQVSCSNSAAADDRCSR